MQAYYTDSHMAEDGLCWRATGLVLSDGVYLDPKQNQLFCSIKRCELDFERHASVTVGSHRRSRLSSLVHMWCIKTRLIYKHRTSSHVQFSVLSLCFLDIAAREYLYLCERLDPEAH